MSNATARGVMTVAIKQLGYKESPAGSNRTKFGKAFGMNGVPWCAEFVWWCGNEAPWDNPIAKSASAAYIQDNTVTAKGGTWIMKKTASNATKKQGLKLVKFGDIVSFDFGKNNLQRQHVAFAIGRSGDYFLTIEGNTSATTAGSQSNGGCVAIRKRHYTQVCSIVRPKYKATTFIQTKPYTGKIPTLPSRGYFKKGDKNSNVKALQEALNYAGGYNISKDGDFGKATLAAVICFQSENGLTPDGEFGKASLKALKAIIDKNKKKPATTIKKATKTITTKAPTTTKETKTTTTVKRSKLEKIYDKAKECAYVYGTKKSRFWYPDGKPKEAYKKALKKAYPDRSKWGKQPRAGASCDVFVGTCIRASGVDKSWPRGLDEVEKYVKAHPKKWKKLKITDRSKMKKGDVIYQLYKGGGGHIAIYMGGNRIANAHYVGKTFGVIQSYSGHIKAPSKCKTFYVFRPL